MKSLRVVIAPDSFKGTMPAPVAARAIARGWADEFPADVITVIPMADGGEGTLEVLAAGVAGARLVGEPRTPQAGPGPGPWLACPGDPFVDAGAAAPPRNTAPTPGGSAAGEDTVGVVELAACCGLGLYDPPAPLTANTYGLGQTIARALAGGATRLIVALGGSASTDGGVGALVALGARMLDAGGGELVPSPEKLRELGELDLSDVRISADIEVLTDVTNPLLGAAGAAATFAPQKGADASQVAVLEAGLRHLANVLERQGLAAADAAKRPGAGAAGGTAFGLATALGARIRPGAPTLAILSGLDAAIGRADVVITGEGQLDATSWAGKVAGEVHRLAAGRRVGVIAGTTGTDIGNAGRAIAGRGDLVTLTEIAGDAATARGEPARFAAAAGAALSRHIHGTIVP
ncbi:glycerate kinase [Rarobacter incanus]|uniref:Glycerate kinase n=1 Tax=Rarobacter incanus TaxID=153494 RepID=A0A542SQQ0_9MICO|nr:glycerate kinase [Rarobacter incanus]TQK76925.1 glycerate kinase [Rarobacter incanus]